MATTIGTVLIDVKADTAKLVSGMDKAEKSVNKALGNMKKAVAGFAAAYASVQSVKAFSGMVDESVQAADAVGKLSAKLGLSSESLSKYQYAAGYAAVSTGELNAALSAMIRRTANFQRTGGGAAAKAFEELGISAEYARDNFHSTDDIFKEVLRRLEAMPDGFRKTAIAQDIFSKSASSVMRLTYTDLQKFGAEAEKIGVAIPENIAKMAAAYNDQMDQISARITGIKRSVSYDMLPVLDAATKATVQLFDQMIAGQNDTKDGFSPMTEAFASTVETMADGIGFIADSWTGIEIVMKSVEYGFYTVAYGLSSAIDAIVTGPINNAIDAYNQIAESLGMDAIDYQLKSRTDDITKELERIRGEYDTLKESITTGRDAAEAWGKSFREALKDTADEAKRTNKAVSDISINAPAVFIDKQTIESDLDYFVAQLGDVPAKAFDKAEKGFKNWGDTLNSSISNALTGAIVSGDVMGAVQSLGGSMASSMIQASVSNIANGGEVLGMGGVGGIAAGAVTGAVMSQVFGQGGKSDAEKAAERMSKAMDDITASVGRATRAFDSIGKSGAAFRAELLTLFAKASKYGADSAISGEVSAQITELLGSEQNAYLTSDYIGLGTAKELLSAITGGTAPTGDYSFFTSGAAGAGFSIEEYRSMQAELANITAKQRANIATAEESARAQEILASNIYATGKDFEWLFSIIDDAASASEANIKTWSDSFKSQTDLLKSQAEEINASGIATTLDGLNSLFIQLKNSGGELTSAELDFLNANKSYIDGMKEAAKASESAANSILLTFAQLSGDQERYIKLQQQILASQYITTAGGIGADTTRLNADQIISSFSVENESVITKWLRQSSNPYASNSTLLSIGNQLIGLDAQLKNLSESTGAAATATTSITTAISDFTINIGGLTSAVSSFDSVASSVKNTLDSINANNASYSGGLYRDYLAGAENMLPLISSGNYTTAQASQFADMVSKAGSYANSYLSGVRFDSVYDQLFAKASISSRFSNIANTAASQKNKISDVVAAVEAVNNKTQQVVNELASIKSQLATAAAQARYRG